MFAFSLPSEWISTVLEDFVFFEVGELLRTGINSVAGINLVACMNQEDTSVQDWMRGGKRPLLSLESLESRV